MSTEIGPFDYKMDDEDVKKGQKLAKKAASTPHPDQEFDEHHHPDYMLALYERLAAAEQLIPSEGLEYDSDLRLYCTGCGKYQEGRTPVNHTEQCFYVAWRKLRGESNEGSEG